MEIELVPFSELLSEIIDNRGRTCPTEETGIPLIATNCIRNDLLYPAYEKIRYVSRETYETWFRGHPRPGDLIFVTKGTPGRVCIAPDSVDFCIAQDMVAIRADPDKVYSKYLFALLRSPAVQTQIEQMHVGTLIPHFKKGDFDKLFLPVPIDRRIQRFIGDAYFDLSAKIELDHRMNRTLENMAQALFKAWFVDFEPVRAKAEGRDPGLPPELAALFPARLAESELGQVPEGWRTVSVGDEVKLTKGVSYRSAELVESSVALVTLKSIRRGGGYKPDGLKSYIGKYDAEQVISPGELVVAQTDITQAAEVIGKPALVLPDPQYEKLVASLDLMIVRPISGDLSQHYFYLLFQGEEFQSHIYGYTNGTTVLHLSKAGVPSYLFVRPPEVVAREFTDKAKPLFDRIMVNEKQNPTLTAVRDALLPKLISGEVQVKDAEKFIAGNN
jgi:type I restriction enzyme, S subunit